MTADVEHVRTVTDDELEAWTRAVRIGFLLPPVDGALDYWRARIELDRTWAAFDGEAIVGTLRSDTSSLTVPGGTIVPAAALTAVTVAATHRRRGLLTRMITADMRASRDRGEPLGMLIASEYPIYGRFGYGPATEQTTLTVDCRTARFRRPGTGSVAMVSPAEFRELAPPVYEELRRTRAGTIQRDPVRWDEESGLTPPAGQSAPRNDQIRIVCRDRDGRVRGFARYRVENRWDARRPDSVVHVDELVALDVDTTARLWRYLTEIDWVTTLEAENRPPDDVLPLLLTDARLARQTLRADLLWVRIFDAPRALSARRYAAEGSVVLELQDAQGLANGRYRLEGGPDGATCTQTNEPAELTLAAGDLGAAYLGGTSLRWLAAAGRVDEHRHGALARAHAMVGGTEAPWTYLWF